MQWSEIESILRENIRIIIVGALGLILLGGIIGLIAGLSHRNAFKAETAYEEVPAGAVVQGGANLLPEPVVPEGPDISGFILFDDAYTKKLENLEIRSNRLSDLFSGFKKGQPVDVKPFVFKGQEMDILTDSEEIIEP